MKYLFYIIAGALGIGFGKFFGKRKNKNKVEMSKMSEKGREAVAQKIQKKKDQILERAKKQGKITNNDVEKMFCGLSDSTAENYLDQLEKEGHLKQVGDKGRGVYYTPTKNL